MKRVYLYGISMMLMLCSTINVWAQTDDVYYDPSKDAGYSNQIVIRIRTAITKTVMKTMIMVITITRTISSLQIKPMATTTLLIGTMMVHKAAALANTAMAAAIHILPTTIM